MQSDWCPDAVRAFELPGLNQLLTVHYYWGEWMLLKNSSMVT